MVGQCNMLKDLSLHNINSTYNFLLQIYKKRHNLSNLRSIDIQQL
jgi:hypothetical protein